MTDYRRKKKRRKRSTLVLCIVVEIAAVLALILMLGWKYDFVSWVSQLGKPVVRELDISGINSSYAVLMQARGGKILGEINDEETMYPASMMVIMTENVGI